MDACHTLPRHVQVHIRSPTAKYLNNDEKLYFDRVGGAVGAPASALYSLPDTSGVLAASRAGTGDLYAQVVVRIGVVLIVLVLVLLVFLTQAEFYF